MRLWGLALTVPVAVAVGSIMAASSASAAATMPTVSLAARIFVPAAVPAFEPAPDDPEPAPSEAEPPPSERAVALAPPQRVGLLPATAESSRFHWPLWRVLTGSALIAGGGVMFGFGLSALAYDGICVPTPPPGVLACRRYYDTHGKGVALVTAGALTAVAGVLLATIPSRRSRIQLSAQLQLPSVGIAILGSY